MHGETVKLGGAQYLWALSLKGALSHPSSA